MEVLKNDEVRNQIVNANVFERERNEYYHTFTNSNKNEFVGTLNSDKNNNNSGESEKLNFSKPLYRAVYESNVRSRLPVFSLDFQFMTNGKQVQGVKKFVVTSYDTLWERYKTLAPKNRCFYEVILHECPCHLYIDVDMDRRLNVNVDTEREKWLESHFIEECLSQLVDLKIAESREAIHVLTLDSSKEHKLSRHFLFHVDGVIFVNNYHCGAFARKLRNRILAKYGQDLEKNPFFLIREEKGRKKEDRGLMFKRWGFYADLAVYTCRRHWRIYGSSKAGGSPRPLFIEGKENALLNKDDFLACMVQRITPQEKDSIATVTCLEEDGSVPRSTNNVNAFEKTTTTMKITSTPQRRDGNNNNNNNNNHNSLQVPEMKEYYGRQFPFDALFRLFGQPGRQFFFAGGRESWRKYTFKNAQEFKSRIEEKLPSAIHIGPVILNDERRLKELVFDIDLNDYGDLRSCCNSSKKACEKCWGTYAQFCIRVLKRFLCDDYGFEKVAFFFSGMKGLHCWVFDESAKQMSRTARETIVRDLNINEKPLARKRRYVQEILTRVNYRKVLIEEHGLEKELEEACTKWGMEAALCHLLWPRIDASVTTDPNHAIKMPYVRHASTGRPCILLRDDATDNPFLSNNEPDNPKIFSELVTLFTG